MKKIPKINEEYYSIKEFCELFDISRSTYYRLAKKEGHLPRYYHLGKKPLIARSDILKWLKDHGLEI